jgi:DNA-binding XRE family transcriptional regulator
MRTIDGAKLEALRESRLLERWQLAKQANVSPETVRLIERGEYNHRIRFSTIHKLAEGLGVEPHELVGTCQERA